MKLYVVRNKQGQFFRAKGYGGSGSSWVDTLERARLYTKIGPAKATVTFFAMSGPQHGVPELVEFTLDIATATVIDMTKTATKAVSRIQRRKLEQEARSRQREIDDLQAQQTRTTARLAALKTP